MIKGKSYGDTVLNVTVYMLLTIFALCTLLPFANVLSKSVSAQWAVVSGKVSILPVGFQLETMKFVVSSRDFVNSFSISVFITVVGGVLSILLTAFSAYPLSKKHIPGVKSVLIIYIFTMLFNGGIVPNYMLIKNLKLLNTVWALILPGMISVFNLLIIKNYYESLPESMEESAKLDGASNITILFRIIIPLSIPVIATISLFYAVAYWNDFFNAMMYITNPRLRPLQLFMMGIVKYTANMDELLKDPDKMLNIPAEGISAATIIASTIPIVLVYPFLQKYFIKGIIIGSEKG